MRIHRYIFLFLFFNLIFENVFSRENLTLLSKGNESSYWIDQPIRQLSVAKTNRTTTRLLVIGKPDSVQVGDVLILNIAYSKSTNDATPPTATGWTHVASARYSDRANYRALVMYKIVVESDLTATSYTFDFTSNLNGAIGSIVAFTNVNTSSGSPFDIIPGAINTSISANVASVVANGLLTSSDNAGILMLTQSDDLVTWVNTPGGSTSWRTTSPGFLQEMYDVQFDGGDNEAQFSIGMAWAVKSSAGSTGNGLVNQSAANRYGAILLALKPVTTTPQLPLVTSTLSGSTIYGTASSYQITASYNPTSFSAASLPTGMSLNTTTGVITIGANTPAGNHAVSLSATNANGTGDPVTLNYSVTKKVLKITANNIFKCFGATHVFNTALFSTDGLVPGETITAVDMTSIGAAPEAITGEYQIELSNATGTNGFLTSNYQITYDPTGMLSVRPINSWHGSVSSAWDNTANWCLSGGQVPGVGTASGSSAIIYPSNIDPEIGNSYSLLDLVIHPNVTLFLKQSANITILGSLTNDGLLNMEANTRVIFGTGAHTVSGSAITSFVNLTVNSGTNIALNQSIQVTNNLTLTNGYLVPAADKLVTIGNGATVNGASNTSYVRGAVKKIGTNGTAPSTFNYPVGNPSTALYRPVGITFPNLSSTDDVTVSYHEAAFNTTQKNSNIKEVAPEYWNITPGSFTHNSSTGLNVSLHYKNKGGGKYFTNATSVSHYKVGHYNTTFNTWEVAVVPQELDNSVDEERSNMIEGFAIAKGVKTFSPFTMLEIVATVLPVKLTHFNAKHLPENRVGLSWSTEFEQQNKGFIIERAGLPSQGKFQKIGYVFSKGISGSSSAPLNYSFTESVPNGETYAYYRIVQEDLDGKLSPSEIKLLKFNVGTPIQIAVQSTTGRVTISRNPGAKKLNYRVTDQMGRIITEGKGIVDQVFMLQISSNGIYNIQLFIPETGEQLIKRVLIQK